MSRRSVLVLIASMAFCGCSESKPPAPAPSPSPPRVSVVGAPPAAVEDPGRGAGLSSGHVSSPASEGPRSSSAQPAGPKQVPLTRAERDAAYERIRNGFPQEPSQNRNPTRARAEGEPKKLEDLPKMNGYDIVVQKSQPSASFESEQSGRAMYLTTCAGCHGEDGKPNEHIGTLGRYNMADLRDPMQYKYGADGRGIFRSIAFGTKAPPHGTYNGVLSDQQIWNIVAFIESIQKAD